MQNNDQDTSVSIREQILTQSLEELKQKAGAVIESIMGDLYSDYLPHVVGDTDANISYRVEGCIKNILQGKIHTDEDYSNLCWVDDTYGSRHMINLSPYSLDLKPLADIMGETIQSNRIKQLEQEVESLKSQLKSTYEYQSY